MPKIRIVWPPKESKAEIKKDREVKRDGEPALMSLDRWGNDSTLRCDCLVRCCDCGLTHLHTYEVLRDPDGKFHLIRRAYRLPKGE